MLKSDVAKKSKMGRPRVDSVPLSLRLSREQLTALDDWRRNEPDLPGRTEAIRRLMDIAMAARKRGRP
jgi:hypothetical protein